MGKIDGFTMAARASDRERGDMLRHANAGRTVFYKLASRYLPAGEDAIVVDIGAGHGGFVDALRLDQRFSNVFLLDGNEHTVSRLRERFTNVLHYVAPGRLPFDDGSVAFVNCSHMIEHLQPGELYTFLLELDRVLAPGGTIAASTPLLWDHFYNNLFHARPYNPSVLVNYFTGMNDQRTRQAVATSYQVLDLTYRYERIEPGDGWHFSGRLADAVLLALKKALGMLGLAKYRRNGYTLVIRKTTGAKMHEDGRRD